MQQDVLHFDHAQLEQAAIEMPFCLATCRTQLVRLCPDLCRWCLSSIACSRSPSDSSVDCIKVTTEGNAFLLVSCAERAKGAALRANACWEAQLPAGCSLLGPKGPPITRYRCQKLAAPDGCDGASACSGTNASIYASCPNHLTQILVATAGKHHDASRLSA